MKLLNRYFSKMSEIIFRHNGTIDKFMGDSIMALFGAPVSRSDDLQRAITCAIEMQLAMEEINEGNKELGYGEIFMGIGINSGEVVAGNLGSKLHSEYTVIGDEVNLASRVESHSLRGQVLLSENAYLLAKDYVEVGDVNEVFVKGKKDIVLMYEVLSTSNPVKLVVPSREIRRSPRVEVDMPIDFYVVDGKSILPEEHTGTIIDMSYGGLMIKTPVLLKAHSQIKFVLSLSLMGNRNSDVYATLLRIIEGTGEFKCQMEFTSIEPEAKRELKEFIDSIVENT
jgi:adenylate cyclase